MRNTTRTEGKAGSSGPESRAEPLGWKPVEPPGRVTLTGRFVRLEPFDPDAHAATLFDAAHGPGADPHLWDYMSSGPFADLVSFRPYLDDVAATDDPLAFTVVDLGDGTPRGMARLMRIDTANGVGEIGHIWFGSGLQRTPGATEAIFLLAGYMFDTLGYRRFEWKCNAANGRSRRAAERFGFSFEGIFRQHMVVKDRNRDTAWFAIIDRDWPMIRRAFALWLDPANFDAAGQQKRSLTEIRAGLLS
ncbi:MAG TPA: GNAT family protein [Thermomicrobiales bacterium]|nr:GNAT family protein [Thermomicrobiales bacterium]